MKWSEWSMFNYRCLKKREEKCFREFKFKFLVWSSFSIKRENRSQQVVKLTTKKTLPRAVLESSNGCDWSDFARCDVPKSRAIPDMLWRLSKCTFGLCVYVDQYCTHQVFLKSLALWKWSLDMGIWHLLRVEIQHITGKSITRAFVSRKT